MLQNNHEFMQSVMISIGQFGNKSGEKQKFWHFLTKYWWIYAINCRKYHALKKKKVSLFRNNHEFI